MVLPLWLTWPQGPPPGLTRMQWIPPYSHVFFESKTNTMRITLTAPSTSTTVLTDLFLSPNPTRNGPADNAVLPVTGFIDLGSTTRPFAGATRMFLTSNPHHVIFLTFTLLHIGILSIFVFGAPGAGSWYCQPFKASPFGRPVRTTNMHFTLRSNDWPLKTTRLCRTPLQQITPEDANVRLSTIWSTFEWNTSWRLSCRTSKRLMSLRPPC